MSPFAISRVLYRWPLVFLMLLRNFGLLGRGRLLRPRGISVQHITLRLQPIDIMNLHDYYFSR